MRFVGCSGRSESSFYTRPRSFFGIQVLSTVDRWLSEPRRNLIAWSPTALEGIVEVRLLMEGALLTRDMNDFIKPG